MATFRQQYQGDKAVWHEALVEFLADPLDKRTIAEFADANGVSSPTVFRYKSKYRDELMAEVEAVRKKYMHEMRSRAMKALGKKVDAADVNALKLFFQISGDLMEPLKNPNNPVLSPEEKDAQLKAAIEGLLNGQGPSRPTQEP